MIEQLLADRVVAVVGQSGYGKTTIMKRLLEQHDRVIILEQTDLKTEYPNVIRYNSYAEMRYELLAARPRRFRVALAPGRRFFRHTLALAWLLADPDVAVFVEEAGRYFEKGDKAPAEILEIADRGRHSGPAKPLYSKEVAKGKFTMVMASQRPVVIPKDFRAQLNRVYAFRLGDADDRDWLAGVPNCSATTAAATKDLPRFNYFNIDTEGETRLEQTKP